jgi:hypothetical protein
MGHVSVLIRDKEDAKKGLFDTPKEPTRGELKSFAIAEGGTASGDVSVAFLIELPSGEQIVAETTGNLFNGMASAFKGARERFNP